MPRRIAKTIKDMPEHTRPREKLREKGPQALTDEELVAAILGRGTAGIDVRTMARKIIGLIRKHRATLRHERCVRQDDRYDGKWVLFDNCQTP